MTRKEKLKNLLVAGVNEAINQEFIILSSLEDANGQFYFDLFGKPSKFIFSGIGHGEIRVTIWWGIKAECKDSNGTQPLNKNVNDALEACCSGYLERKDGKWLQDDERGGIYDCYCSVTANKELDSVKKVKSEGFNAKGKFYM